MNRIKRRFILTALALSCAGFSIAYGTMVRMNRTKPVMAPAETPPTFVIDAGHGGMDGGAVGIGGAIEKDINLAISLTLRDMLRAGGYKTVMVRETDVSVHDPEYTTVRQQKVSDIKNRLKLAESTPNAIFISVHQNRFEQSKYHGAQMFYSANNPQSQVIAETLRAQFRELLQPDNQRETKPAGKNLFILYHAKCPAVLVECGFLSNPEEEALLSTEEYQRQVAFAIYTGLLNYLEGEGGRPGEEKEPAEPDI